MTLLWMNRSCRSCSRMKPVALDHVKLAILLRLPSPHPWLLVDVNNRPPQPPLSRPHATLPSISSRPLLLPQAETMPNPSYPPLAHTTAGTSPAAPGGVSQTVGRFPFLLMSSVGFPNHQTDALQSPRHVTEPNSNATQTLLAAACGGISLPATFHYVHPSSDYHASTLQLLSRVTTNLNAPHVASALPWSSSHMN